MYTIPPQKGGEIVKGYMIIYRRSNGELITRYRNTMLNYSKGDITSMGWIVEDIKYLWHDKYYSSQEYAQKLKEYRLKQQKPIVKFLRKISRYISKLEKKFA